MTVIIIISGYVCYTDIYTYMYACMYVCISNSKCMNQFSRFKFTSKNSEVLILLIAILNGTYNFFERLCTMTLIHFKYSPQPVHQQLITLRPIFNSFSGSSNYPWHSCNWGKKKKKIPDH